MVAEPLPSSPGPRPVAPPDGVLAAGTHLGAQVWWCEQLFAVAGGWVPSTPEAPARIHLAELSRVAGDVAVALRAHLPRPAPVDPDAWVTGPAEAAATLDAPDTLGRLAGVHRALVPRLLVAWAAHEAVADRALARTLGHARRDLAGLWVEGEALLQAHVAEAPDGPRAAADRAAAVEAALLVTGGVTPGARADLP